MPRYYCDYCDTYLTHDSVGGRKQHNRGIKHRQAFQAYYEQFLRQGPSNQVAVHPAQALQMQFLPQHPAQALQMQQQMPRGPIVPNFGGASGPRPGFQLPPPPMHNQYGGGPPRPPSMHHQYSR